jgi:hypothetical protein
MTGHFNAIVSHLPFRASNKVIVGTVACDPKVVIFRFEILSFVHIHFLVLLRLEL